MQRPTIVLILPPGSSSSIYWRHCSSGAHSIYNSTVNTRYTQFDHFSKTRRTNERTREIERKKVKNVYKQQLGILT